MPRKTQNAPARSVKATPAPPPAAEATAADQDARDVGVPRDPLPFPVVGIGASAGGLEAFTNLLKALPADTGMAFVFVQHLAPAHVSALAEILSRATPMPVREVQDATPVEPNHVYVIPPGQDMVIVGDACSSSRARAMGRTGRSIGSSARWPKTVGTRPSASSCPAPPRTAPSDWKRSRPRGALRSPRTPRPSTRACRTAPSPPGAWMLSCPRTRSPARSPASAITRSRCRRPAPGRRSTSGTTPGCCACCNARRASISRTTRSTRSTAASPAAWSCRKLTVDGMLVSSATGSCCRAVSTRQTVAVPDIAADPQWAAFYDFAQPFGLRACWSTPILSVDQQVLGTFANYYRALRDSSPRDQQSVEMVTRTVAVAIERKRAEKARRRHADQFETLLYQAPLGVYLVHP